jgi:hypothetical protein
VGGFTTEAREKDEVAQRKKIFLSSLCGESSLSSNGNVMLKQGK